MSKVVADRLLCAADNGLDDPDLFSISHLHDMRRDRFSKSRWCA
jgi:hypothetical protein